MSRTHEPAPEAGGGGHRRVAGTRARARRGARRRGLGARDRRPPGRPARRRGRPPRAASPTVVGVAGDVTDPRRTGDGASPPRRVRSAPCELLVNNASTLGASPLPPLATHQRPSVLRGMFDMNVIAPIALVQALDARARRRRHRREHHVRRRGRGRTRAGAGTARRRPRSSTRAGCSPSSDPTWRVLVVDPGDMRTEMHQDAFPGEDISDRPGAGRRACPACSP